MLYILLFLLFAVCILLVFIFIRGKSGIVPVRIGKRGSSVLSLEIPYNNQTGILPIIIKEIKNISNYRFFLVCSGVNRRPPNTNISGRDYFVGALAEEEIEDFKIDDKFDDISIFMLNEGDYKKEDLLLTHDLIVSSAQIPDREVLYESGFILTAISASNLFIITGVRGVFERALLAIFEAFSQKSKRLLVTKM